MLHDSRRAFGRRRYDRDVEVLFRRIFFELGDRPDGQGLPPLPDLRLVDVVDAGDVESALGETTVAGEGSADLSRADDANAPLLSESEDLAQLFRKLGNGVAEAAFAKRAEARSLAPARMSRRPRQRRLEMVVRPWRSIPSRKLRYREGAGMDSAIR